MHKSRTYTTHQGLRAVFAQSFAQSYPQGGMKARRLMKLVYWMDWGCPLFWAFLNLHENTVHVFHLNRSWLAHLAATYHIHPRLSYLARTQLVFA